MSKENKLSFCCNGNMVIWTFL